MRKVASVYNLSKKKRTMSKLRVRYFKNFRLPREGGEDSPQLGTIPSKTRAKFTVGETDGEPAPLDTTSHGGRANLRAPLIGCRRGPTLRTTLTYSPIRRAGPVPQVNPEIPGCKVEFGPSFFFFVG